MPSRHGCPATREEAVVTAVDARARLVQLETERREAARVEPAADEQLIARLGADVAACRAAYVGLAVTELASFRAPDLRPQVG